jgi:hypothetical protein
LFAGPSWAERRRLAEVVRDESVGGALLLVAAVAALVWVNSPWSEGYLAVRSTVIGPAALHLNLSLASWAADGLLAVFFFVAGLEVKRAFVAGDLRDLRRAALPVTAAIGGVVTPIVFYLLVIEAKGGDPLGWAIPVATDIAFAVAVLAVVGGRLPPALRTFLLTLAVVDDLIAITIIAVFFTADLRAVPLLVSLVPLVAFGVLVRRGRPRLVVTGAVGCGDLGAGARLRGPCDGRRGAPGVHRAGPAAAGRSAGEAPTVRQGQCRRARVGGVLRAPVPSVVGGCGGPGVRVLRCRGASLRGEWFAVRAGRSGGAGSGRRSGGR